MKLKKQLKKIEKNISEISNRVTFEKEVLMTRTQAADFLSVSLTTLRTWTESKIVLGKKLGGRIYYLKSDLLTSLQEI